jgi:acyl-CoA synthetase (AMP-forming)/AMP-acid ligase II
MTDTEVGLGRRIRELAAERPGEIAYRHIGQDGSEPAYTWGRLDDRSSRLAGALAKRGVGQDDLIGIGLRNGPRFVLAVFAAWKLGAVPVPVRWDVPEWELQRLREVIRPAGVPRRRGSGVDRRGHGTRGARTARCDRRVLAWHLQQRVDGHAEGDPGGLAVGVQPGRRDPDDEPVAAGSDAADHPGAGAYVPRERLYRGSVGRGVRGTEVRILGSSGEQLPPGEIGEIFLRSPGAPRAPYLGDVPQPVSTPDGFRTVGDLGRLDEEGFLYLADRRVDVIISGGANIFPAEVETALIDHPGVADVVVIGVRDPEWGRRVHALIEAADPANPPTLDEIRAYAKSRLARYKVPKSIEIVDAIPRSAATKVNRGRLIETRGG